MSRIVKRVLTMQTVQARLDELPSPFNRITLVPGVSGGTEPLMFRLGHDNRSHMAVWLTGFLTLERIDDIVTAFEKLNASARLGAELRANARRENEKNKQAAIDRRAKRIGFKAGSFTTYRDIEAAEKRAKASGSWEEDEASNVIKWRELKTGSK